MQISDIQESLDFGPRTRSDLDRLVEKETPELVVLCGDNCNGHSHEDCFRGDICGISVSLDACEGYSPYGIDSLRGGRVFILDENAPESIETYMSHYSEL